jgi:hypothetical protein
MFEPGTPHSGRELQQALSTLLGEGMAWQSPRSDAWFFAPQGTAWAPSVHFRHLRKSTTPLVTAIKLPRLVLTLRFGRHSGPSRSFAAMHEAYMVRLAAGATAGGFTPKDEAPPANPTDRRQEILSSWTSATVNLTNAMAEWPEDALDQYQLPHPLLGTLSLREMLAFTVFHTAHHLRRMAERSEPVTA